MLTITLQPDIAGQVTELASNNHISTDAFVDQALRNHLAHFRREKIHSETAAFQQQQAMLLERYPEQYVAIHNGELIDHDADLRTLHLRIHARLGRMPVLLKQVTHEPERELVFRNPLIVM
jgi:predicted transcriptional regulator